MRTTAYILLLAFAYCFITVAGAIANVARFIINFKWHRKEKYQGNAAIAQKERSVPCDTCSKRREC